MRINRANKMRTDRNDPVRTNLKLSFFLPMELRIPHEKPTNNCRGQVPCKERKKMEKALRHFKKIFSYFRRMYNNYF